ncbi:DUF6173 family protein [Cochlodiniinecator piscidefendens]|uniref:DUF6173 family protein n=1 Tax=Cochlodiniinecator piscidefendens TaxID=2715756 RepID=UPI001408A184|nr:DUF6173 family protein [Cochlodiniinecator piscidefendens]
MADEIQTSAEAAEADALPRSRKVRCNPDGSITAGSEEVPETVAKTPVQQKSAAQWAYERIILYIQNFEKTLDNEQEAAMGFAGGDVGVMRIEGMGYFDPDLITFYGTDENGSKTQLVQHVTQLNVMLRALPKAVEHVEPNRIGFRLAKDLEDS